RQGRVYWGLIFVILDIRGLAYGDGHFRRSAVAVHVPNDVLKAILAPEAGVGMIREQPVGVQFQRAVLGKSGSVFRMLGGGGIEEDSHRVSLIVGPVALQNAVRLIE